MAWLPSGSRIASTLLPLALVNCLDEPGEPYPQPPEQTSTQKSLFEEKTTAAKAASDAATPHVLAFFDSAELRAGLEKCCPAAAALTSQELLERFREEVRAAELAHSFPSTNVSVQDDTTVTLTAQYPWFLNQWQAPILQGQIMTDSMYPAETDIFGCTPFASGVPTWEEAADRLIYIAHNLRQMDTGSVPTYGDVSAVFSSEYARDMVLIAPVDSGRYESLYMNFNKSYWDPPVLGTLDHHDHLILANFGMWGATEAPPVSMVEEALGLFKRSAFAGNYSDIANGSYNCFDRYWEANILGNPRLPDGVRFLIADFSALFGTEVGTQVRDLANQYNWPLTWALGAATTDPSSTSGPIPGNHRILDPLGTAPTNASMPTGAASSFDSVWTEVAAARAASHFDPSPDQWGRWWAAFAGAQTRLAPLTARACGAGSCVGTNVLTGDCVCVVAPSSGAVVL